jgi:peptide/nickel transport system substrate-binding protein
MGATAGGAAAAAFLAACGDDDDGGSSTSGSSGSLGSSGASSGGGSSGASSGSSGSTALLAQPVDAKDKIQRGGVSKWVFDAEPPTLDIHVAGAPLNVPRCMVYSDLFMEKPGYLAPQTFTEYDPDLAESWEFAPDRLSVTFKLRSGVKWHNKPPVNGRLLDTDDIKMTWDRFVAQGRTRTTIANAANPNAPVLGWEMPNETTLVMTMKEPASDLFASFTAHHAGLPSIIPKETDNGFDMRHDMIGTGPWMMSEYLPSVSMKFDRHPDYYFKDRPFIDSIEAPYVTEYSQRLAQFRTGAIYAGAEVAAEDILQTKSDIPELNIYAEEPISFAPGQVVYFGWLPTDANKPFKDERVRQALSMSYDRDAFIDTFYNVKKFEDAGLPVKTYWNSAIGPGAGDFWLDPRNDDFGENSKYYEHNIEEAKKLLDAAGFGDGINVQSRYIGGPELGATWQTQIAVTEGMAREVGFNPEAVLLDYASEYGPKIRDGHGKFEGWGYTSSAPPGNDAVTYFAWRFQSTGQVFPGFDVNGTGDGSGDPHVDQEINKARLEFDTDKRKSIILDLQRYLGKTQYIVPIPGFADNFVMAWPAVGNYDVWHGDKRDVNYSWWLDSTKAPLA